MFCMSHCSWYSVPSTMGPECLRTEMEMLSGVSVEEVNNVKKKLNAGIQLNRNIPFTFTRRKILTVENDWKYF